MRRDTEGQGALATWSDVDVNTPVRRRDGLRRQLHNDEPPLAKARLNGYRLSVLDRLRLMASSDPRDAVQLCAGSQRLLAVLALNRTGLRRDLMTGLLWPDRSEERAHACLRSALSRLAASAGGVVVARRHEVWLADQVRVDLDEARTLAHGLLQGDLPPSPEATISAITTLSADLLPGWYEDWSLPQGENWRQLRLHALETLAGLLRERGRFAEAGAAGRAAITADPLRESSRVALIEVYIAEGNRSDALREFDQYRRRVREVLAAEPTERLCELIGR